MAVPNTSCLGMLFGDYELIGLRLMRGLYDHTRSSRSLDSPGNPMDR